MNERTECMGNGRAGQARQEEKMGKVCFWWWNEVGKFNQVNSVVSIMYEFMININSISLIIKNNVIFPKKGI